MAHIVVGLLGIIVIVVVLLEVFETIVLPRRVTRRLRLVRLLYNATWLPWRRLATLVPSRWREAVLGVYGPLALLMLLAIWTLGMLFGYALLQWANGSVLRAPEAHPDFSTDLYFSASTFFTLGLGDVVPRDGFSRPLAMIEAANGFSVLALVIGYLPALYQTFSRREVAVTLLDARAGSPPSATELVRRYAKTGAPGEPDYQDDTLTTYLHEWESWAAELMESHLSYPMLAFFRSQHDNQSWLAALTTILDTCALTLAGLPESPQRTARLTFAMGRHAVVDLAQIFWTPPRPPQPERLSPDDFARMRAALSAGGLTLVEEAQMAEHLTRLRAKYEPYVFALSQLLVLPLPPWVPADEVTENWRSTAWEPRGGPIF